MGFEWQDRRWNIWYKKWYSHFFHITPHIRFDIIPWVLEVMQCFTNTLKPRHFVKEMFYSIYLKGNLCTFIQISKFDLRCASYNSVLLLVVSRRRLGHQPFYEPGWCRSLMHICAIRPHNMSIRENWILYLKRMIDKPIFFTEYRSSYSIFYWIHRHSRSQLPWFRHNNMYWWIHVTHTPYSGGLFIWWWRHYMNFSALLAFCEGNPLIARGFPTQRPVAWSLDIYFDAQTFEIVELPMILRHHDSHVAEMTLKGK